ncbi:MAG: SusD/RagB family nutrient-binding outer membrane lipoprotein [Bacteroidales bacterium]|nr:SusD/RagB family nutrient-binding outer membrane lipoprotein [Bacteroidales bacterium]
MENIINKIRNLAFIGCIFLVSCEKLQDINDSPNSLTSVPDQYLFTNAAKWAVSEARQLTSRSQLMFTGAWAHLYYTPYAEDRYEMNYDTDDESILWGDLYSSSLTQSNNIVKITGTDGTAPNTVRNAMSQILTFIAYIKLTDLFGSIPYIEGGKGISYNILTPKYDTQEFIYHDIIEKLGKCITVFESGNAAEGYGSADPFYSGDLTKWIKYANSFRLRLAMRMRYSDPSGAATAITACLSKPLMESNADNALIKNFNVSQIYLYSGWYEVFQNEGKSSRPSKLLIDELKATSDPRLPVFAISNTTGGYEGVPNGVTAAARALIPDATLSSWQPVMYAKDIPSYALCYAEVCFLKAEAALYGIGRTASTTDANAYYQDGIEAAMGVWGVKQADIDNFISTQAEASLSGTQEDNFRKICTQEWLSFITNNYEAFNIVRRTGYPVVPVRTGLESPYALSVGITVGQLPSRATYPSTELTLNRANYDDAIAKQGADTRTTKLWWDSK